MQKHEITAKTVKWLERAKDKHVAMTIDQDEDIAKWKTALSTTIPAALTKSVSLH